MVVTKGEEKMKKALFPSIALVLVLGLALMAPLFSFIFPVGPVLAAEDDPYVCLESLGPGEWLDTNIGPLWAGLFHLRVDGELRDGWCIEAEVEIGEGWCFNATLLDKPRETPWCEIGYIMANYSPDSNDEAAAIQLAIWKYMGGGKDTIVATTPTAVEPRAREIYDDAAGKCLTSGRWVVVIDPTEKHEEKEIQKTIILTDPSVGGDVEPVNKVSVLVPWIGLALLLIGGMTWFTLRRRST